MSNPDNIRAAVQATLHNTLGSTWSVSKYYRSNPDPPEIDMMFGPLNYDLAMHDSSGSAGYGGDVRLIVRAVVQGGEDINYQAALDPLIDWAGTTTSLKAILEADKTLGGTVSSIRVADVSELKLYPGQGGALPGVEFNVVVTPNNG